jgi:hypothetical protein
MLIGITIVAVIIAFTTSIVAWRAVREERRRSDARVVALARDIHGAPADGLDLDLQGRAAPQAGSLRATMAGSEMPRIATASPDPMFATMAPARSGSRFGLALAIGCFVAASVGAAAIVLSGAPPTAPLNAESPSASDRTPAVAPANRNATVRSIAPLELLALAHEREGDTLTVRGTIRNPASGSEMNRLTAVVFLFDRDGGFLSSGRAAVESPALIPGGESTFVVTIAAAGDVARYRVSFRSGDQIVSHVDKRSRS